MLKKLNNIFYLRVWINLFNYKGSDSRKQFIIDFVIHTLITIFLCLFASIFQSIFSQLLLFIIFVIVVYLFFTIPFLSMAARRIRDTGNHFALCFLSLFVPGNVFVLIICLFKSQSAIEKRRFKAVNFIKVFLTFFATGIETVYILFLISGISLIPASYLSILFVEEIVGDKIVEIDSDNNNYETRRLSNECYVNNMPSLNSLSNYKEVQYTYLKEMNSRLMNWSSEGLSLFVSYDEVNYEISKQDILSSYTFLQENYLDKKNRIILPAVDFSYKGYDFKIVSSDELTCKAFMIIGFNEQDYKISYQFYLDDNLEFFYSRNDRLALKMQNLMKESFYWYRQ